MILANTKKLTKQTTLLAASLLLAVPLLYFRPQPVSAATLASRNVTIGDSKPGTKTSNQFKFTISSYTDLGSIEFEYCENTPFVGSPCTPPAGLSVSGATLGAQSGEIGFSIAPATSANRLVLTRTPVASSGIPASYTFNNIINPGDPNKTVYVRISTFESADASGSRTDEGTVVFATTRNVTVDGFVPLYLTFCVGVTVEVNCSSATGSLLNFGELATNQARALTSQYAGASNDPGGYSTTLIGSTMTSGNNTIPALEAPQASRPGVGQFGMNLRANSNPSIGTDPVGPGSSEPAAQLASPNQYFFRNQVISSSPIYTDFDRFTATYLVNVGPEQRPGIYSTTLSYIATAAF